MRSTHRMQFNTDRRLFHGRPRPSFRRFGFGINGSRTFQSSSPQISHSMTHRFVDATTGAYGRFLQGGRSIASGSGDHPELPVSPDIQQCPSNEFGNSSHRRILSDAVRSKAVTCASAAGLLRPHFTDQRQYRPELLSVYVLPFTCAVAVIFDNCSPGNGAGCVQVAIFPLRETHESGSDH